MATEADKKKGRVGALIEAGKQLFKPVIETQPTRPRERRFQDRAKRNEASLPPKEAKQPNVDPHDHVRTRLNIPTSNETKPRVEAVAQAVEANNFNEVVTQLKEIKRLAATEQINKQEALNIVADVATLYANSPTELDQLKPLVRDIYAMSFPDAERVQITTNTEQALQQVINDEIQAQAASPAEQQQKQDAVKKVIEVLTQERNVYDQQEQIVRGAIIADESTYLLLDGVTPEDPQILQKTTEWVQSTPVEERKTLEKQEELRSSLQQTVQDRGADIVNTRNAQQVAESARFHIEERRPLEEKLATDANLRKVVGYDTVYSKPLVEELNQWTQPLPEDSNIPQVVNQRTDGIESLVANEVIRPEHSAEAVTLIGHKNQELLRQYVQRDAKIGVAFGGNIPEDNDLAKELVSFASLSSEQRENSGQVREVVDNMKAKLKKDELPKTDETKQVVDALEVEHKDRIPLRHLMVKNLDVRTVLDGEAPENPEVTKIFADWARAPEQTRGKREIVEGVIKNLSSVMETTNTDEKLVTKNYIDRFENQYKTYKTSETAQPLTSEERKSKSEKDKIRAAKDLQQQIKDDYSDLDSAEETVKDISGKVDLYIRNEKEFEEKFGSFWAETALRDLQQLEDFSFGKYEKYIRFLTKTADKGQSGYVATEIHWKNIPDWPVDKEGRKYIEPGRESIHLRYFSPEEAKLVEEGDIGIVKLFWNLVRTKESMPRQDMQFSLTELSKLEEIWDIIRWKHKENALNIEQTFRMHLDIRPGLHHRIKVLLHEPVGEEDQLKALIVSPDEYSYLVKVNRFAPRAISLYEEATRNLQMHKRMRFNELQKGNSKLGILNETERFERINKLQGTLKDRPFTKDEAREYLRLLQEKNDLDSGVVLWAEDVQFDADRWRVLQERKTRQNSLEAKLLVTQDPSERIKLQEDLADIALTKAEEGELQHKGKSPLDVEVERLLRLDLKYNLTVDNPEPLDIELALHAARTYNILTLQLIHYATMMAEVPKSGKARYRAPAFERIARILSPEMLQRRFEMGAGMGAEVQAKHLMHVLEEQGFRPGKDPKIDAAAIKHENELKQKVDSDPDNYKKFRDPIVRRAEAVVLAIQEVRKIPFQELIRGGYPNVGGPFQTSTWRPEIAIHEPLMRDYAALGKTVEYVGLGLQIAANPFKQEKQAGFRKMVKRLPWVFAQYNPDEFETVMAQHPDVNADILQNVLLIAQMQISHDPKFNNQTRDINLGNDNDFKTIIGPILDNLAVDQVNVPDAIIRSKLANPAVQKEYLNVIKDWQATVEKNISAWSDHKWPLTLTYSDIDLGHEEFYRLGEQAIQRRFAGDMSNAYKLNSVLNAFHGGDLELISPADPVKSLEQIREALKAQDSWLGRDWAERTAKQLVIELIEMNEFKHRWIFGWIPGFDSIVRNTPALQKYRSLSSSSIHHTGGLGNNYSEKDLWRIANQAREMQFFTQHPEYYFEIIRRFNLGVLPRTVAFVRDN